MSNEEAWAAHARRPDIPPHERRAMRRRLFRSARYNRCDGLDDYAEDFTVLPEHGGKHRG
jgi:hypothetical protein